MTAAAIACDGALANIVFQGVRTRTMLHGITIHEVTIKMNQMFSQAQRCSLFMGTVKSPLHIPERAASTIPMSAMSLHTPSDELTITNV
jgi:hypothetical protein